MENIAPSITRQRLLIEGFYSLDNVNEENIKKYFTTITNALSLKAYGDPIIFSPGGKGKKENQGYDAFVPLIDSGISLYVWTNERFFSVIIYTCKSFDTKEALNTTKQFFISKKTVWQSI